MGQHTREERAAQRENPKNMKRFLMSIQQSTDQYMQVWKVPKIRGRRNLKE